MRYINKGAPPVGLENYKKQVGAKYKAMGLEAPVAKNELRAALLSEQGYVCGYCGSGIDEEKSVVEHIKCRDRYPTLQLDYLNMICSCEGGQNKRSGNSKYPLYCDAAKGSHDIPVSPLDLNCAELFVYDEAGGIHDKYSQDARSTIEILNLNNPVLKNRRKAAINYYKQLSDEDTNWDEELQHLYFVYDNRKHIEFCFVIEYYITNYRL